MKGLVRKKLTADFVIFAVGGLLGLGSIWTTGCTKTCGEDGCPVPLDISSGQFGVSSETRTFDEANEPSGIPDLSEASMEIDAAEKKVTLMYTDSLGEPVQVTFERRADGGGAGEGGR